MTTSSSNFQTSSQIRGTMARMTKSMLATVALVGSGLAFAGVEAAQPAANCHVISTSTRTETQVTSGAVNHRTVTTTKQRCRGHLETSTSYGAWH